MEKRYFVLQQKFLSLERSCLRRRKLNTPHSETLSNPSLELCLNMITPMLSAYDSIPLSVSFECISALIKHGKEIEISKLIAILHTDLHPLQYPIHFVTQVRDWIETILYHIYNINNTNNMNTNIVEKSILSLLEFGLITTSVSCLLKATEHLLANSKYIFTDKQGIINTIQKLFTISLSEPKCFHHLDHFPMTIPDKKKYQKINFTSTNELLCIAIDYSIPIKNNISSNLIYLYDGGIISDNNNFNYEIPNYNNLSSINNEELNQYKIRHIACINSIIIWYNIENDNINCLDRNSGNLFSIEINWPEERGSREVAGIFSEGEFLYFVTGQSNPSINNELDDNEEPNDDMDDIHSSITSSGGRLLSKSGTEISEKEKNMDNQITETQRLISCTEVIIFKFQINIKEKSTKCLCTSVLDHPYGSWTKMSYFLTDGKWLIISSTQLKETYNFLYAEFTSLDDEKLIITDEKIVVKVRSMQKWGTDPDWFTVTGPNAWDTKMKRYWEFDVKEKVLLWVYIKCLTPKFLRASESLSAQSLIKNINLPNELFHYNEDNTSNDNNNLLDIDISNELASICIISALDHIIQIRSEGSYTTERSKSVFTALLNILEHFSNIFLNQFSSIKYNSDKYWIMVTGLIGCLRNIKIQISYCLNEQVAIDVGLYPLNNDKSCIGVKIREILFQLIRNTSIMDTMNDENDKFILYIKELSTEILFSNVEVLYHPDELGDLLLSMVTRNSNEPEFLTFLSLLNQMSLVSDPSLLILTLNNDNIKNNIQVKTSILNCLFQILGEEFIAAMQGNNITKPILEAAGTLLTTIHGTLTLKAWRSSKDNFSLDKQIKQGNDIWLYCSFGDELLSYCKNLLNSIDTNLYDSNNFINALNNPLFTELLPSYIHSFYLNNIDKQLLLVFYNQSGIFIELLNIISNINKKLEDVNKYEFRDIPNSLYKKEFYVVESKHPYITQEGQEDFSLVDTIIHPGALFLKLNFDSRSKIHQFDTIKFYRDNQFAERARLIMNGKIYYGLIDGLAESFPTNDIITIGDTLILCFESCCYKPELWGFRLEVTAYYPSDVKLYSYFPLLEIERSIALVFSIVIRELFKDPILSDDYKNMEKKQRKWINEPNGILYNGSTFNKNDFNQLDHFSDILPGESTNDAILTQSLLTLNTEEDIKFIENIKNNSKKPLSWTNKYIGLFDPLVRNIFVCLLYHTDNINLISQKDPNNIILIYLWEQSQSIQQWAKNYHQQHIDIPFESICRALCLRVNFLLTIYKNNIHKEDYNTINNCKPIVSSILSFIKVEDLSLDGIIEILSHKSSIYESRVKALEILHQLLSVTNFSSVKYCILSQFSFPRHILSGLEGCNPNQTNHILQLYSSLLQEFCNIFTLPLSQSNYNTINLSILTLSQCTFVLTRSNDYEILYYTKILEYIKIIMIQSSEYINEYSLLLFNERSKFTEWKSNQDIQLINNTSLEVVVQKQKSMVYLYSICIRIFYCLSSQCLVPSKNIYQISCYNLLKHEIINYIIDILLKTKSFPLPNSDIITNDSYPSSELTSEQLALYDTLNDQIQDQSSDALCFDTLTFLLSIIEWNNNILYDLSKSNIIHILFELLISNTPRVQLLIIRILSLLIKYYKIEELDSILLSISKDNNKFSISNTKELFNFFYTTIGIILCSDISQNQSISFSYIGKRNSLSISIDNESPIKKRKVTSELNIDINNTNNNNNKSLLELFFYNRTVEEKIIIVQELCSFFRSLLLNEIWNTNIQDMIYNSLSSIPKLLKIITNNDIKYKEYKELYENIISGFSIIGGHNEICRLQDIVKIKKNLFSNENNEKDEEGNVILLDKLGLKSYIFINNECDIIDNENIKAIPRISYNPSMIKLLSNHMINILNIINEDYISSNIRLFLLGITQKVIYNNIHQFMDNKDIIKILSSKILNISLHNNIETNPKESIELLTSKKQFYYSKLISQHAYNNSISYSHNMPHYYTLLKKQFKILFPYSIFHSLNFSDIEEELKLFPLPFSTSKYSLILPCGMKIAGGTKITNTICNNSTILTLTIVTWANFAIPLYPVIISFYFEVEILNIATGGDIGIGILDENCTCDHVGGYQIGSVESSFAYVSNGTILAESIDPYEEQSIESYGKGDVIGCILSYTEDGGDYLLSFTKNGKFLKINGEDDGYMHLPNLKLKFIPIIGLRGNGTKVEVNFGHKPYKYDTTEIMKKNKEIKKKQIQLPSPSPVLFPVPSAISDSEDDEEDEIELNYNENSGEEEILSPHQGNIDFRRYFIDDQIWTPNTPLSNITSNKELIEFESSSRERILNIKPGDLILHKANSYSNSQGFIQTSAEIISIDFVSQLIQVVQRKNDLGVSRCFWIRLNDFTKPIADYIPPYDELYSTINEIDQKIVKLEARNILLELLSNNLTSITKSIYPNPLSFNKLTNNHNNNNNKNIVSNQYNLIQLLIDKNPTDFIKFLKLCCSNYIQYSILHEQDVTSFGIKFQKLPCPNKLMDSFISIIIKYLSLSSNKIESEQNQFENILFNSLLLNKDELILNSILENKMVYNIVKEQEIKVSNSTIMTVIPNRTNGNTENTVVYLDKYKSYFLHQFSHRRRPSIRPILVQQQSCRLINYSQKFNESFICEVLPKGYLYTNDIKALTSFNYQYFNCFLSIFCDIYYNNQNNEKIGTFLKSIDITILFNLLNQSDCIIKPYIALLLTKIIRTLSLFDISSFNFNILYKINEYCSTILLNPISTPITSSLFELQMSIINVKSQLMDEDTMNNENIVEDDEKFLAQDNYDKDNNLSFFLKLLNTKDLKDIKQDTLEYSSIMEVIPILSGIKEPNKTILDNIYSSYYIHTRSYESDHPCSHSQREKVTIPGASGITIHFDQRCKLHAGDLLTFSVHNRRGADDLGSYPARTWSKINVPGDCFYFELQLDKYSEYERYQFGYKFTVVPYYDNTGIDSILQKNEKEYNEYKSYIDNNPIQWTDKMNVELIQFSQNLAAIHSYNPETMTVGDLLMLMKRKSNNDNNDDESNIELPDIIKYPTLNSISYYHILYRFSLISLFNQGIGKLLEKLDMDLVNEWWSLAYQIQKLCSVIFTSTKINFIKVSKPENRLFWLPIKVAIDRRLAQDSKLIRDSSFYQLYSQLYDRFDVLIQRAYYQSQPFEVKLLQEGAIDQGGPFRDCLMQIVSDTQGDKSTLALFIKPTISKQESYIPNSLKNESKYLNYYKFIGQLLGMCIRTADSIPFYFSPIVWKWLVNESLSQDDYYMIDENIQRITNYLNSETKEYYNELGSLLTFTIIKDDDSIFELKENGSNIYVNSKNKKEYLNLINEYYLNEIRLQLDSIKDGFSKVVPKGVIPLFTSVELQERIAGKRDIDIEYLKQHTIYDISEDSPVVKYFWDTLRSFTNDQKSMFLRFVWGRSTLPASPEEFTEQFCISEFTSNDLSDNINEDHKLPHAHTCAFQIELPHYSSEKVMKEKLLYAITNCRDIDLEWQTPNP